MGREKNNSKIIIQNLLLCYYNSNIKDNNSSIQKRVIEKTQSKTKEWLLRVCSLDPAQDDDDLCFDDADGLVREAALI